MTAVWTTRRLAMGLAWLALITVEPGRAAADHDPAPPPAPAADGGGAGHLAGAAGTDPIYALMSFAMASEKIVKGAPYSAEAVSEFHQVLIDGNHIDRSRSTQLYRDGEGRTRQEMAGPRSTMIFLNDAPAGRRYLLDPERKIAVLLTPTTHSGPPEKGISGVIGSIGSAVHRAWSRVLGATGVTGATSVPTKADAGMAVAEPGPDGSAPPGPGAHGPELASADGRPADGMPPLGSGPGGPGPGGPGRPDGPGAFHPGPGGPEGGFGAGGPMQSLPPFVFHEPRGQGVVTALGAKDIGSLHADGTRTTWTIPAGQQGNEKPIVLTSDQWYAPELLLVVYTREYDPRTGESIYQIKDLKRAEPPRDLFTVPADYTLVVPSSGLGQSPPFPPFPPAPATPGGH